MAKRKLFAYEEKQNEPIFSNPRPQKRTKAMPRSYGRRAGYSGAYKSSFRRYKFGRRAGLYRAINTVVDKKLESKWICFDLAGADLNGSPITQDVSTIAAGTGQSQRIGNRVSPTYIEWKLLFNSQGSVATNVGQTPFVRVMLVQSRYTSTASIGFPATPGECMDYDDANVFFDRIIRLTPANNLAAEATDNSSGIVEGSLVLKGLKGFRRTLTYDSANTPVQGPIALYIVSDTTVCDLKDGYVMMKYKDG